MDTVETYRVVPTPTPRPSHLALARTYDDVNTAVAAMGEGVVMSATGRLVAFHERHLGYLERRAQPSTTSSSSSSISSP